MNSRGTVTDKLADVIQVLQIARKTGFLIVKRDDMENSLEQGTITFQRGQIIDADVGSFKAGKAFSLLMTWRKCHFVFETVSSEMLLHNGTKKGYEQEEEVLRIWEPVDSDAQVNGTGSYATILDQNGIRIAYSNPDRSGFTHPTYLFKAVAPISLAFQQRIVDEDLYGNSSNPVSLAADQKLVDIQHNHQLPTLFQIDPVGQNQTFEAARYNSTVVPWTYFVFKPFNAVTGIADQQILGIILIIVVLLIVAILVGLVTGRRITLPILHSVTGLRKNSQSLKMLASKEHRIATEQTWMIEGIQLALESVKYYTNAASVASRKIRVMSIELRQHPNNFDAYRANRVLQEMMGIAEYIERAIKHQEMMNEKLAIALRVTTQTTEQLTGGAKSTDDAALQLEYIVNQLTAVVGEEESILHEQQV